MSRSQVRWTIHRLQRREGDPNAEHALHRRKDRIAVEAPLAMRLSWQPYTQSEPLPLNVTMRTPGHDYDLVAGFLYTEGIIEHSRELGQLTHCVDTSREEQHNNVVQISLAQGVSFDPDQLQRRFITHSSCGVCGKTSIEALEQIGYPTLPSATPILHPDTLFQLEPALRDAQALFSQTGGIHAAALFDLEGQRLSLREDVGRHNALDKLIGQQLLADTLPLTTSIIMVSGRISFELVQKARRAGAPIMVAVGAPSSLAIELAEATGMTLIGFLKEDRCNVYTHHERLQTT